MSKKISAVISTFNDEDKIKTAIESVKWVDEIIVCDLYSQDKTVEIAKKLGAKVFFYKNPGYVEPVRNFAISKATNEWTLILDPDEEIPEFLGNRLKQITKKMNQIDYVRVPRKNLIFGKWMRASMWWPDYNIRFFKKGRVEWTDKIHRPPKTLGAGLDLEAEEKWAIIHHNYENISEFLERMNRYTKIQADELEQEGYIFDWRDLIKKPISEFLGRFFANRGFEDGLHGFSLSLLQAFSFLIVYLKVWELKKFKQQEIDLPELEGEYKKIGNEFSYWIKFSNSPNLFKEFVKKIKSKLDESSSS